MLGVALLLARLSVLQAVEPYAAYVSRSMSLPSVALASMLESASTPALRPEDVLAQVEANTAFLDAICTDSEPSLVCPSMDARIAVPLLVQVVREWSAHGRYQRIQTYAPLVEALLTALAGVTAPRVLVPGSGLGRLVYDIAEALGAQGPTLVAVESDVHAQLIAKRFLEPAEKELGDPVCSNSGQSTLYPSLHVATGWTNTSDRLAAVRVPDVSSARRQAVQERASVQLVVGRFPGWPSVDDRPLLDGKDGEAVFDGAVTSFFLDVAVDVPDVVAALHRLLLRRRGTWANLGPVAYPEAVLGESLGGDGSIGRHALTVTQVTALVRAGGFELLEERMVPCEYGGLPRRLERTERECLFFVAVPRVRTEEAE